MQKLKNFYKKTQGKNQHDFEFGNEFLSTILKAKFIKENNFKGEVKMAEQEDPELVSPYNYIKNTSTNGTILTEHLLNISGRLWTCKRIRKIP